MVAAGWAWAAAIVWLSLTPSPPDAGFEGGDKVGHFGSYALLTVWFFVLYRSTPARVSHAVAFLCLGAGLEIAQGMTAYRTGDAFDMLANALGVLAGAALGIAGPRILRR